jgi:CRP/FNR family transcriptional regulator, cyclic AMP receptor protein
MVVLARPQDVLHFEGAVWQPCEGLVGESHGMSLEDPELRPLEDQVLREIAAEGCVRHYRAGSVLISEGDEGDSLFVLLEGRVKVYTSNDAGRELVLTTAGAGEILGEVSLDGGRRSASVMALTPCRCAVVRGADLRLFLARHPGFAHHLILKLIGRVRRLTRSARQLALDDVYTRVAALLEEMAVDNGQGQRTLPERLTQQEMADRIGSSREMISRVLKELVQGGYVDQRGGRIALLKPLPRGW